MQDFESGTSACPYIFKAFEENFVHNPNTNLCILREIFVYNGRDFFIIGRIGKGGQFLEF